MDDILQIKREHITEPIKRSIKIYGNKPQRLALILNMAITELVLLISKMLEAARAIRNKILHTDVTNAEKTDFASNIVVDNTDNTSAIEESIKVENKITTQEESIKEVNVTEPDKPVMTPETAAYPKLKKIKVELDNQNKLIFEAEQQRGNFEIELSDLKGLAKLTRKAELQRKIDEKTYYINRLKIGLSNMVRNYGFENMNEFYLSYKESQNAYAEYQQEVDDWKKSNDNAETPIPNGQCPDGYPPTGHTGKQRKRQCHDSPFPFPESAAIEMPFRPRDHISKPHDRMRDCPGIPKGQIQQITRNQGKNNQPHLIHKALI